MVFSVSGVFNLVILQRWVVSVNAE